MQDMMIEPKPITSPRCRPTQCTDQEVVNKEDQLHDEHNSGIHLQEHNGELAIGAAEIQSNAIVWQKGGINSNFAILVKPSGVTFCVQGECTAGKTVKDNQNETLKEGMKCEEENNVKGHVEKLVPNNKADCKGIQSVNNKQNTGETGSCDKDVEKHERHELEKPEKDMQEKCEEDDHMYQEEKAEKGMKAETDEIEETDGEQGIEKERCEKHEEEKLEKSSRKRRRKRKRKKHRNTKQIGEFTHEKNSKIMEGKCIEKIPGIVQAAGGQGATENKGCTRSNSNTKSRQSGRYISGGDGKGGSCGGGCGGEPPIPPNKDWKRKLSCDGLATPKNRKRRPSTRLVMRQDSHSSLPSPIIQGTQHVRNESPSFSLPPTGVLPTEDHLVSDFVQHAFEHIHSESSTQRWLTHNCPPCKTLQAYCHHLLECEQPVRCRTCTKLLDEVRVHVNICQKSEQQMCGMDFCQGFFDAMKRDKNAQFSVLSKLASSLINTSLEDQHLHYPIQRQQSNTPAPCRKTSKSSMGGVSLIHESDVAVEQGNSTNDGAEVQNDKVVDQKIPQENAGSMDLEEDSPNDSEDENEVEDPDRNKPFMQGEEFQQNPGPAGDKPLEEAVEMEVQSSLSTENTQSPGTVGHPPMGEPLRQCSSAIYHNTGPGRHPPMAEAGMEYQRQFSSESSMRSNFYPAESPYGTSERFQRQFSSEGHPGIPLTNTNLVAFQDYIMNKQYHTQQELDPENTDMQDTLPPPLWKRKIDVDEDPTVVRDRVKYGEIRHLREFLPIWAELQKNIRDGTGSKRSDQELMDYEEGVLFCTGLQICKGRYRVGEQYATFTTLGSGSFGTVYLCKDHDTGYEFVVKMVDLTNFNPDEAYVWSEMDHPNIVRLLGVVRGGSTIYFFSEFCADTTLKSLVQKGRVMSQGEALYHMQQLFNILCYVHDEKRVVHKDLKPENLLVTSEGRLLLIDWGLAKMVKNPTQPLDAEQNPEGTQHYMAPEIARGEPYAFGADIWSSICIGIHLISGYPPWAQRFPNFPFLFYAIGMHSPPLEDIPEDTNPDVRDLLTLGMTLNPVERPRASQLLEHKAFKLTQKLHGVKAVNEIQQAANPPPEGEWRPPQEDDWQPHFAPAPEGVGEDINFSLQDPTLGMAMMPGHLNGNARIIDVIHQQRLDQERVVSGINAEDPNPAEHLEYPSLDDKYGDGYKMMMPSNDDQVLSPVDDPMSSPISNNNKIGYPAAKEDEVFSPIDDPMTSVVDINYQDLPGGIKVPPFDDTTSPDEHAIDLQQNVNMPMGRIQLPQCNFSGLPNLNQRVESPVGAGEENVNHDSLENSVEPSNDVSLESNPVRPSGRVGQSQVALENPSAPTLSSSGSEMVDTQQPSVIVSISNSHEEDDIQPGTQSDHSNSTVGKSVHTSFHHRITHMETEREMYAFPSVNSDTDLYGPSLDDFVQEDFQPSHSPQSSEADSKDSQPNQTGIYPSVVIEESERNTSTENDGQNARMSKFASTHEIPKEPYGTSSNDQTYPASSLSNSPSTVASGSAETDELVEEPVIPQPVCDALLDTAPDYQMDVGTVETLHKELNSSNHDNNNKSLCVMTMATATSDKAEEIAISPILDVLASKTTKDVLQSAEIMPKTELGENFGHCAFGLEGRETDEVKQSTTCNLRSSSILPLTELSDNPLGQSATGLRDEKISEQQQSTAHDPLSPDDLPPRELSENPVGQKAIGLQENEMDKSNQSSQVISQPSQSLCDFRTTDIMSQNSLGGSLCSRRPRRRPNIKLAAFFSEAHVIPEITSETNQPIAAVFSEAPPVPEIPNPIVMDQPSQQDQEEHQCVDKFVDESCQKSEIDEVQDHKLELMANEDIVKGSMMETSTPARDDIHQFLIDEDDKWRFQDFELAECTLNNTSTPQRSSSNTLPPASFDMDAYMSLGKSTSDEEFDQLMAATMLRQASELHSPEDQLQMMAELDHSWQIPTSGIFTTSSCNEGYAPPELKTDEESITTLQKQLSVLSVTSNGSSMETNGTKITILAACSTPIHVKMRHEQTIKDLAVGISAKVPDQFTRFTLKTTDGKPVPLNQAMGYEEQTFVLETDPNDCIEWDWCVRSRTGSVEYPGDSVGYAVP